MNPPNDKPEPTKGVFSMIDLITGRIGKITALLAAVCGLILGAQQLYRLVIKNPKEPGFQVKELMLPDKVKFSELDSMPSQLKGSGCDGKTGLWVTFTSLTEGIRLEPPNADNGLDQEYRPDVRTLWDNQKPVCSGKGDWEWNLFPPQFVWLKNPRDFTKFRIRYEVKDLDSSSTIQVRDKSIELVYDVDSEP
jgi:hypothetical protein